MAAFAVIAIEPSRTLDTKVGATYPNASHRVSSNVWLVADTGVTTEEVCQKLGIEPGGLTTAVVFKIETYFGFASKAIWEWLAVKGSEL